MLKPIVYKYHTISKGQSFVNYLFLEIILNNRVLEKEDHFSLNLVIDKYKCIIDNINDKYLLDHIILLYDQCKNLNSIQRKVLRRAVYNNNKIEQLCKGEIEPVTYREISLIDENLSKELQELFGQLYKSVIDREPFYSIYGHKSDFYKQIIGNETICCCCGVGTMPNKHQNPVGALDHYFPINHYPFSSINFKNLVPICDICNSKYKTQKDTLFEITTKTKKGKKIHNIKKYKAFYPYSTEYEIIDVSVSITNNDLSNLTKEDISIEYTLPNCEAEIVNWERLFNVSEIHKANLIDNSTMSFINRQFDLMKSGFTFEQCCDLYTNNLFYDKNFIRVPYFRDYYRILNE